MIAYFDTSSFVKLVAPEAGSPQARELWVEADVIVSSELLYPEFRAALARMHRLGRLPGASRSVARARGEELWRKVQRIEVDEALARDAGELAETHALRAYDAVHLASVRSVAAGDFVLATSDGALLRAAQKLGITTSS